MQTIAAALIFLLAGAAHAEYYPAPAYRVFGKAPSDKDEKAIDELIDRFRQAWASQNAAALAALHAQDAEWTNAFGRTFRNAAALEAFLAETLFPAFEPDVWQASMESYQPISRRYIGAESAVIHALAHSGPGSARGAEERRVSFHFVLAKTQGQWKIVHQAIADVRPRRSSG